MCQIVVHVVIVLSSAINITIIIDIHMFLYNKRSKKPKFLAPLSYLSLPKLLREYVVSLYVLNLPVRNNKNSRCPS